MHGTPPKLAPTPAPHPGPGPGPGPHPHGPDERITIASWAGPVRGPQTLEAAKQAMADRLVESLAPFLIVVTETVFFGYGWFYGIESGYTPCDGANRTQCLAPDGWFPEYSKRLGAPKGAATQSGPDGMVWRREFAGASVFVDLRNRSACSVVWK
eukprot:g1129.t1